LSEGKKMKRYGMTIGLAPGAYEEYKRYHAAVWPEVMATTTRCNIRNFTIYHHDGTLFGSFEYHGTDYRADMAVMAADPATQRWWAIMEPLQRQIEGTPEGDWWMPMEELFHQD
jgi:L-rhamnose mutarotase